MTTGTEPDTPAAADAPALDRAAIRTGLLAAATALLTATRMLDDPRYVDEDVAHDLVRYLEQVDEALTPVRAAGPVRDAQADYDALDDDEDDQ